LNPCLQIGIIFTSTTFWKGKERLMKKDESYVDKRNINSFQNEDVWRKIKNQIKENENYSEMERDNLNDMQNLN